MITMQQLVVGLFGNRVQTEQAINELHQAGFHKRDIWSARHGISIGEVLEKIKSLLTGRDTSPSGIYIDLLWMGIPLEDAHYYQSEFAAGRSIVAIPRTSVPLLATNILARNGGCSVSQYATPSADYAKSTGVLLDEDLNAQLNGANQPFAPSLDYNESANIQEPTNEDVNAQLESANQPFAQSTDSDYSTSSQDDPSVKLNLKDLMAQY